ncbi:MAG: hypothetical protein RSA27_08160 [Oscillospiraceae bacterium]
MNCNKNEGGRTNIIKVRFVRNEEPQGREYTYYATTEVAVGDTIALESKGCKSKGIVTQVNVPEEEIAPFKDKAKSIIGLWIEEIETVEKVDLDEI